MWGRVSTVEDLMTESYTGGFKRARDLRTSFYLGGLERPTIYVVKSQHVMEAGKRLEETVQKAGENK